MFTILLVGVVAIAAVAVSATYIRGIVGGLRTDVVTLRRTSIAKAQYPGTFWFYVAVMSCAAVALLSVPVVIAALLLQ